MLWLLFFKLYCSLQLNVYEQWKDSEVDKNQNSQIEAYIFPRIFLSSDFIHFLCILIIYQNATLMIKDWHHLKLKL